MTKGALPASHTAYRVPTGRLFKTCQESVFVSSLHCFLDNPACDGDTIRHKCMTLPKWSQTKWYIINLCWCVFVPDGANFNLRIQMNRQKLNPDLIFTAAPKLCLFWTFSHLRNCTRFIFRSLLSGCIVQHRVGFPGRWIVLEITHTDDKWPSSPHTSSGGNTLFPHYLHISEFGQKSFWPPKSNKQVNRPLTCCLIFQVIDTWEALLMHLLVSPAACTGPG